MPSDCSYLEYEPDRFGRVRRKQVNHVLNMDDFKDTPGYSWLLIAANPHLSAQDIQTLLWHAGEQHLRSASWIRRHRWLFSAAGTKPARGPKPNGDGLDGEAFKVIDDNGNLSSRQLAGLLRKMGIPRSPEWVRQHRVPT